MNKIQTNYSGGMPLELNDLRWLDDAIREAFYGIISAFGITAATSFKLSGCEVTIAGQDYTTTAGFICLNGEVLKVDAHTATIQNLQAGVWELDISYDTNGREAFSNLSVHETYEVRRAKLVSHVASNPPSYMMHNAPYLLDIIRTQANLSEGWREVGAQDQPEFDSNWSNYGSGHATVAFRKGNNGVIHFKGVATSAGSQGELFTLPTGYRPSATRNFYTNFDGLNPASISVLSDGKVWINTVGVVTVALDFSLSL